MRILTCVLLIQNVQIEKQLIDCIQLFDSIRVIKTFKNPIELIEKLHKESPDILFLNADIKGVKDLDLLRMIHRPPFIIGITSNTNKTSHLLDNGFSDIIGFNFNIDVFCKKISKILNTVNSIKMQETFPIVRESVLKYAALKPKKESKNFIFTKYKKTSTKLRYEDILYVRNTGNLLKIEDVYGNSLYHLSTLKKFMEQLPKEKFIRINKSIIVDFTKIDKFYSNSICVRNEVFKISRIYFPRFKEMLKETK